MTRPRHGPAAHLAAAKILLATAVLVHSRSSPSLALGLAAAAALTSFSSHSPGQTLTITSDVPLSGDLVYQEVTIDAEVSVPAYDPDEPGSGWLRIYADRIVIGETGRIDADGSGYDAAGPGPGPGGSAEPGNPDQPAPGGGGAHVGAGASGAWGLAQPMCPNQNGSECQLHATAPGGIPYEDPMNPLALALDPAAGMGSAGGRSWAGCPNQGSQIAGGAGGGTILLYANQIDIRGTLSVRGTTPAPGALLSPGGGAGGTIIVSASTSLSFGASAELLADGADGVAGNARGGGGGGGLIVVASTTDVTALLSTDCPATAACSSVAGGSTASCMEVAGAGARVSRSPLPCPDADGDGFTNAGCLDPVATDCNDADPLVNPDAEEICDGIDNDCDGGTDENPDELCPASLTCVDGACEAQGDGGGPVGPPPAPPRIELSGGLCTLSGAIGASRGPSTASWFASLLLLGLGATRRRRPPPTAAASRDPR